MKPLTMLALSLSLFDLGCGRENPGNTSPVTRQDAPAPKEGKTMPTITITHAEARNTVDGSADYFTGSVRVQELFSANSPPDVSAGSVTFQPGARSAWHTHPRGQTLIVTAGTGWV